jgi:arginine decarboxylase
MLPINNWEDEYERVFLGGMTCDSDDYYNSEQHVNAIYMPQASKKTGSSTWASSTRGPTRTRWAAIGGIQHCLIPKPKYVLIDRLPDGSLTDTRVRPTQSAERMLDLLGY